jgi:hypothetical protein
VGASRIVSDATESRSKRLRSFSGIPGGSHRLAKSTGLVAEEGAERTQDPLRPYEGPIYLQPVQEIRYGITFSVPMDVIRRFLDEHQSLMRDRGYPLSSF